MAYGSTKVIRGQRLYDIEKMLCEGQRIGDIKKVIAEKYKVAEQSVQNEISKIYKRWEELSKPNKEFARNFQVERLMMLYQVADVQEKIHIERLLAKLLGTEAPTELNLADDFWSKFLEYKQARGDAMDAIKLRESKGMIGAAKDSDDVDIH